jgi:hypothetical protein
MKRVALILWLLIGCSVPVVAEEVFVGAPPGAFYVWNANGSTYCGGPAGYYLVNANNANTGDPGGQTHAVVRISGLRLGDEVSFSVMGGSKRCMGGFNPGCAGGLGAYWMADPDNPEVSLGTAAPSISDGYNGTMCVTTGVVSANGVSQDLMITYRGMGTSSIYNAASICYGDLVIEKPDYAVVHLADGVVDSRSQSWGALKSLYR